MSELLPTDITLNDPRTEPLHYQMHNAIHAAVNGMLPAYDSVGDNSTDNTTVLQASIDALATVGGGTLFIPEGIHQTDKLTLKAGVSLAGVPGYSILKLRASQNTALLTTDGFSTASAQAGLQGFRIEGITFDGNKASQASNADSGLVQLYGYRYVLRDVNIRDGKTVGLYTTWGTGSPADARNMEARFDNVKIDGNVTDGWYHNGPHDSVATSVICSNNGGRGFYVGSRGGATKYIGCHSWGNSQTIAWEIDGPGCHLIECEGEGASTQQAKLSAADIQIMGGLWWASGGAAKGIEINAVTGCQIWTKTTNCTDWAVKYTSDPGGNDVRLVNFGASGAVQNGNPHASTYTEYTSSGGQTGEHHSRQLISFFFQDNVAASQTGVALGLNGTTRTWIPMMRPGSITGVEVRSTENITAGTLSAEVSKNGTGVGLIGTLTSVITPHDATEQAPNIDTFTYGDQIGVLLTTTADFEPAGSMEITVTVEIAI